MKVLYFANILSQFFRAKQTMLSLDKPKSTAILQQLHVELDAQNSSAIKEIPRIL